MNTVITPEVNDEKPIQPICTLKHDAAYLVTFNEARFLIMPNRGNVRLAYSLSLKSETPSLTWFEGNSSSAVSDVVEIATLKIDYITV